MNDLHNTVAAQNSRLAHQENELNKLRRENAALQEAQRALKEQVLASRGNTPFPTCGICSGDLVLTQRTYSMNRKVCQEMTEHWACPRCASHLLKKPQKENPR